MKQELALKTDSLAASSRGVQLASMGDMLTFAQTVCNSGMAPAAFKTPEAILVAIQHGMELGLSPMQALHSIAIINGKPGIYGDAALALCKARPDFVDIEETFERGEGDENLLARCVVTRNGQTPTNRTFSIADAKKAGLWGKSGPWSQYPKRMLQFRARSFALRDSFPDALKGIGIREEIEDIQPVKARVVSTEPIQFADEPPAPIVEKTEGETPGKDLW